MSYASDDLTLRRAGPDDAVFMHDLAHRAYQHYVTRIGREPGPMVEDYDRLVAEAECWIVRTSGGRGNVCDIGYLVLRVLADHLLLDNVAVAPDRQGQGVGAALLNFTETRARAHGQRVVRLFTHETMVENIAFYTRHGYAESHRHNVLGFRRVFMRKDLGDAATQS